MAHFMIDCENMTPKFIDSKLPQFQFTVTLFGKDDVCAADTGTSTNHFDDFQAPTIVYAYEMEDPDPAH